MQKYRRQLSFVEGRLLKRSVHVTQRTVNTPENEPNNAEQGDHRNKCQSTYLEDETHLKLVLVKMGFKFLCEATVVIVVHHTFLLTMFPEY